jgi:predicted GTPase
VVRAPGARDAAGDEGRQRTPKRRESPAAALIREALPVSALHNVNVGLLPAVVAQLPETTAVVESDRVRLMIIGRPNVGKSMLVNAIRRRSA